MNPKRKVVYDKYEGKCAYCGIELNGKFQIDHCIPQEHFFNHIKNNYRIPAHLMHLKEFDCNHPDNLMPACGSCNNYKSSMDLKTFRDQLSKLVGRLNEKITIYKISKRFGFVQEVNKPIVFYFESLEVKPKD